MSSRKLQFTLKYPPELHANIDIPYGSTAEHIPEPYNAVGKVDATPAGLASLSSEHETAVILPSIATVLMDSKTGFLAVSSVQPNVQWDTGCVSWHAANGDFRMRSDDAPNFVATSGATLWLKANGTFQDRGTGVHNCVNSAGFAMVLLPRGGLKKFSVRDINGVNIPVDKHGIIAERYGPRPLQPTRPWTVLGLDLRYHLFTGTHMRLAAAITGPLSHPAFLSNGDYPNLLTVNDDTTVFVYHYVHGFPYVRFNEWWYEDRDGPSKFTRRHSKMKKKEYAVNGKIIGSAPTSRPIWSHCSKYAIMQVGGTCQSAACLNLLLCCTALRNYCVKAINGYTMQEGLAGLATIARWERERIMQTESFTETILHAIFKRLCGAEVATPETVTVTTVCLREQTYGSSMYCEARAIGMYDVIMIDFLQAVGLHAGLLQPPLHKVVPAKYEYAVLMTEEIVPLTLRNFVLVGAFIHVGFTGRDGAYDAHAVAGITCDAGNRVLLDSNSGEVAIDWALNPASVKQYFLDNYGSRILLHRQLALYLSQAFMDTHGVDAVRCLSTSVADAVPIVPASRTKQNLCLIGDKMLMWDGLPFSIADGRDVDIRGWPDIIGVSDKTMYSLISRAMQARQWLAAHPL